MKWKTKVERDALSLDEEEIRDAVAVALWDDAVATAAEGAVEQGYLSAGACDNCVLSCAFSQQKEAYEDADDLISAFEARAGSIAAVAEQLIPQEDGELPTEDLEDLGYYLAMQALGHGWAWSDSRKGELDLHGLYFEALRCDDAAAECVNRYLAEEEE